MKKVKNRKWMHRALAMGLSMILSVSLLTSTTTVSLAAQEKNIVEQSSQRAGSEDYELMNDIQGANILHCWNWSYSTIEAHMELIAQCGYTAIQTSPATQPKDYNYSYEDEITGNIITVNGTDKVGKAVGTPGVGGSGNWWKVYQPVTFSVCDNGETWFGTKAELESMCAAAERYGIKVIVDIVANHMGNIKGWQNSMTDISPQVGKYWNPEMMTDASYWHINDLQVWMSDGREHFTQGTMGMPDLNTADKRVQKYVYEYLDELIDCGVDGFRFDAAKHIETPDDSPSFASDFWPTVLDEARSHYRQKTGGDLFVYGEILNTVGDNFSIDSYTKYMSVTDNSAGHHLLESIRNNQAKTVEMTYPAEKSVIWAESHDTYMNESSRYASDKSVVRAWAMAGSKNNAASLYFVRPYYSKDVLENDNDGQFKGNLEATLEQAIMGECSTYTWASKEVAAVNHFNNRMAGTSDSTGTDGNIAYCQRGNGIILVNIDGAGSINMSSHGLADGSYTDEVSGNTFTVSGGNISGRIDSEYGVAVVYQNVKGNPTIDYPIVVDKPVISATLPSSTINGEKQVTFSVSNADSATYCVDGGAANSFSGSITLTVGTGKAEGEACTVKITATKNGKNSEQTFTYIMGENKPVLTISPNSGTTFKDTLDVTISSENAVSAYYQIGDGERTAFSNEKTITIGGDMEEGESITITVTAVSSTGKEDTKTAIYTKKINSGRILYFKNTDNWSNVTAYVWNSTNAAENNAEWPGQLMEEIDAENKIYSIDLDGDKEYNMVIFSNNGEKQTGDIELEYSSVYDYSTGDWSPYTTNKKPSIRSTLDSGLITGATDVTFTVLDAETATYKKNAELAKDFTGSVTVTVGDGLRPGEADTIVIHAVNGTEVVDKTYQYTLESQSEEDMSDSVKAEAYKGEYDGLAHSIRVSAPEGAVVSYSTSETGGYQADAPTYRNAGEYTVYYQVKKSGYRTVKGSSTISIGKKAVTVRGITADVKAYDGTNTAKLDFSNVVFDGLVSGDQLKVTAKGWFIDSEVGTDKIVIISDLVLGGTAVDNYQLAENGNQTQTVASIVKNSIASEINVENVQMIYDGMGHGIQVSVPEGATIKYGTGEGEYFLENAPVYSEPGEYTIYFKVSKDGFADYVGRGTIVIYGLTVDNGTQTTSYTTWEDAIRIANGSPSANQMTILVYADTEVKSDIEINDNVLVKTKGNAVFTIPQGVCVKGGSFDGQIENNGILRGVSISETSNVTGNGKIEPITPIIPIDPITPVDPIAPIDPITPVPNIGKTNIANMKITLSATKFNYNNKVQRPVVTINGLKENVDYKVTYSSDCKNIGSYIVAITGIGSYTGTVCKTFEITVYKNSVYTVSGYKYKITGNSTVSVTGATKKTLKNITVKNSVNIGGIDFNVTAISSKAFANYKKLKSVTIGTNVRTISSKAFYGDTNLKKITIKSKKLKSVGSNAVKKINEKAVIKVPSSKYKAYKKLFKSKTGYKKTMRISKK